MGEESKRLSKSEVTPEEFRASGIFISPRQGEKILLQPAMGASGFGRWIYCKYCYKNVRPLLSGINQIVCSNCGAGLTPDFFKVENLKRWLAGDDSAIKDDIKSEEAKH